MPEPTTEQGTTTPKPTTAQTTTPPKSTTPAAPCACDNCVERGSSIEDCKSSGMDCDFVQTTTPSRTTTEQGTMIPEGTTEQATTTPEPSTGEMSTPSQTTITQGSTTS